MNSKSVVKYLCVFTLLLISLASCAVKDETPMVTPAAAITEEAPLQTTAPAQGKIPVIFSHDGALDDVVTAVYLLRHPDIDVKGIVISYGEQHPSLSAAKWAAFVHEVMGRPDIPIAIGAEDPLDPADNAFPDSWRDSADQFWFVDLPPSAGELSDLSGPELIASVVNAYPGEVFVLVTGAQTDLALALQDDTSLEEKIFVVALMGGAVFTGGNLYEGWEDYPNKVSEFNIWVDPLAAARVLETDLRIRMVPLDATGDVVVDSAFTSRLEGLDAPSVDIAAGLWKDEFEWFGVDSVYVWDLLAGVSITHPEFFEWEYDAIDVVTQSGDTHGQTIATGAGSETTWIATAADAEAILDHVYSVFAGE